METNRDDYRCHYGVASWWEKDGLWHVARPNAARGPGCFWTDETFTTREAAIATLRNETVRS